MANFVDIDSSPEALQEDEEIQKAVEKIVETAAASVWSEVLSDLHDAWQNVQWFLATCFPLLSFYQQDASRLQRDAEHCAVFLLFALAAFYLLGPWRLSSLLWWRKPKNNNQRFLYNNGTLTPPSREGGGTTTQPPNENESLGGCSFLAEEVTDEERFAQHWPEIARQSRYGKLVLPPVCRLVEKPKDSWVAKHRVKPLNTSTKPASHLPGEQSEEDNPAKRLQTYFGHFVHMVGSLISYDYFGAGKRLILWIQGISRYRKTNSTHNLEEEDEDGSNEEVPGKEAQHCDVDEDEHDVGERNLSDEAYRSSLVPQNEEDASATTTAGSSGGGTTSTSNELDSSLPQCPATPQSLDDNSPSIDDVLDNNSPSIDDGIGQGRIEILSPKASVFDKKLSEMVTPLQEEEEEDEGENQAIINTPILPGLRLPDHSKASISATKLERRLTSSEASVYHEVGLSSELQLRTSINSETDSKAEHVAAPENQNDEQFLSPPVFRSAAMIPIEEPTENFFFETANSTESLRRLSVEVPLPDKNGYILGDEFLPDTRHHTPLLVFVNSRAGPQQGHLLITQLRSLLNPIQVWDLADGGPETVLESFCVLTRLRILVCGGDGTVSWIISALEALNLQSKWPPIAILPLGTGNDLARIHGWGGGYNNESLITILEQISESYISLLDRWEMTIEDKQKKKETKSFFNYLGVGTDAQAALQVHYLRESRPEWFFSRLINKAWYGVFGAEDIIKASSVNVRKEITLFADGVEVPLPSDSQGIILLNIDSYAGGVPLWSHGFKAEDPAPPQLYRYNAALSPRRSQSMHEMRRLKSQHQHDGMLPNGGSIRHQGSFDRVDSCDDFSSLLLSKEERFDRVTACALPSSCQDGMLEVVSIRGAFHLGQIKVGLSNAQRLCQCREAKIVIKKKMAVQIDGEPWRQEKCVLHVKRKKEPAVMLHRSADDGGVETEMSKLLDWAEERKLFDSEVHSILMKEYSRRIESKTRQRRALRTEGNVLKNLKRAMGSTAGAHPRSAHPWHGGIAF